VVRALSLLLWLLVALPMVLPLLRSRRPAPPAGEGTARDELVKDPVCQTYVLMSRAIREEAGGAPAYFCSRECAARFHQGERRA
jgi:YHS domain-containing protein